MIKLSFTLFLIFGIETCLFAQASFNSYPKQLEKALTKHCGKGFVLQDLAITPTISSKIKTGKYRIVSGKSNASSIKYVYTGRVNTCRAGGCTINQKNDDEKASEFHDYFILFDSACTVQLVQIYNYQATHGQEITTAGWLKQFVGYNGETELVSGKNIDAISGATISIDATTFDIEFKTGLLKQIVQNK